MASELITEGIRYTGSKRVIVPKIIDMIAGLDVSTTLDLFSGTTRVGQAFKQLGFHVDSNDLAEYSKVFGNCYLVNNRLDGYDEIIDHLNALPGVEGYFTRHYGGDNFQGSAVQPDGKKRMWQRRNAMKLDAIRGEVGNDPVLLTSLILALDRVDNGLGHQVSYLSRWSERSEDKLVLRVPRLLRGDKVYNILQQDAKTVAGEYCLAYLDPPYGTNNKVTLTTRVRYASYYHLWTTVCKDDEPEVFGAANRRKDASSDTLPGAVSAYESTDYDVVRSEIAALVENVRAKYVLLSYSSKGKVSVEDLRSILGRYKMLREESFPYRENVMKNCTSGGKWLGDPSKNYEFLFLIAK